MNLSDIPFDLEFFFNDNLREVPISKVDMNKGIKFLKTHTLQDKDVELAKIYGLIGVYSRIVKKTDDSKKYLNLAIEINAYLNDHQGLFVNKLRFAHTYQWEKNYQKSNKLFRELIEQSENDSDYKRYLDFIY